MPELLLFIGLQGAGKSTFFRRFFASTHAHISKDLWPNAKNKDARQRRLITEAFARGQSVVVDNTNLRRDVRAPLIQQAKSEGARAYAYTFEADLEACLKRNGARRGRARVPDWIIVEAANKLERPTLDEGFDAIFEVKLRHEAFEVTQQEEIP